MKRKLTIILIFLSSIILSSQAQVTVSGQVKDMQTKKALEYCSVSIINAKDSLIKNCVTDGNGFFTIALDMGYYRFIFSYIAYKTDTTALTVISENKFLGVFKLKADETVLKELSVKASSHENLVDKDEQIVTDKLKAGTSDTKEVLEKINGVQYDRYSNSIKVDNDAKVIILVDGMEKDQEYIKNLAPDRLKKIEVIRNPGGRYALEGYSAVINIILKKDYQGTEILLSDRSMLDADALKPDYIAVQNNLSGTVNYVYNKLNVYAKYSMDYNNFNLPSIYKKEYTNGLTINEEPANSSDMNTRVKQLYDSYTLGADYYINPKHTISFESNLDMQPSAGNTTKQFFNVNYSNNGNVFQHFKSASTDNSKNANFYNTLFYTGNLDENNVITSNFMFANYSDSYANVYTDDLLRKINDSGKDNKNSTKFYVEYTHTFKNKSNLEVGYGNTWEKQKNNYLNDTIASNFNYTDLRHKIYTYYSMTLGKKIGIKAGGAIETSAPNANGTKRSYIIYQPHADIKYNVSKLLDLKLELTSRSDYPSIEQTNPFTAVMDLQSVVTGNPLLRPDTKQELSLQINILSGLITIEPYFHFSGNYIISTGALRSDSIFEYSYSNAGNYRHYGNIVRFTVPIGKSLFLQSDFDFFKSSIKYTGKTNAFNDWTMSSQLIYQNQKSSTVAGVKYQKNLFKEITAQGYNCGDNDFWIAFVQQPFFKKKFEVMLLYFLPLNLGVNFNQGGYIKTDTYTETKSNSISFLKNMFLLQISYRFNKGKTVNNLEKNIEKQEERKGKSVM